jgi:lysophospholipase L1-like esterase
MPHVTGAGAGIRARAKGAWVLPILTFVLTQCSNSPSGTLNDGAPSQGPVGSVADGGDSGDESSVLGGPDASAWQDVSPAGDSSVGDSAAQGADAAVDADANPGADGAVIDAGPPAVRFIARVDRSNPTSPRFAWSGSTILARFTGSSIGVRLGGPANYYDVRIDGVLQPPLATTSGKLDYPLATNLAAGAPHELSVYRRTEANYGGSGETTFLGLIFDPAGGALLSPSPPTGRRMEIVGDSTTTGYGDEGTNSNCPFSLATENYDLTYGAVAARAVGAELITIAWSGKGMYRNYAGDTVDTMPILYGRTLPAQASSTWDYASWIPDVVVVNLGSNDFQQGDPGQAYVTTYTAFVHRLRGYYPNALIVCAVGPKLSGQQLIGARGYVMGIASAMNSAGDTRVDFIELPQALPADGYGCGGHANVATHKRMGDTLAAELKSKLGW